MDGNPGESISKPRPGVSAACTAAQVTCLCGVATTGRRASRVIAKWVKRFELSEAEFQLLWRLSSAPVNGLDQTALSKTLAFSPAQISSTVERLRARGWICARGDTADRRRNHWLLTNVGQERLISILIAAPQQVESIVNREDGGSNGASGQEAAA